MRIQSVEQNTNFQAKKVKKNNATSTLYSRNVKGYR